MNRFLSGVALAALLFASQAKAADYLFNLTGDMSNFTTSSFMFGGALYETGVLELTGFDPFTLQDGDTVTANVHVTGGSFSLPVRDNMFFGFNLDNILGGAQPATASTAGDFWFDNAASYAAGCGNCTSLITYVSNIPLSFHDVVATGAFAVSSNYDVNHISISYQVNNSAAPEPATWGLMILGFGGAGAMLRRRRPGHAPTTA